MFLQGCKRLNKIKLTLNKLLEKAKQLPYLWERNKPEYTLFRSIVQGSPLLTAISSFITVTLVDKYLFFFSPVCSQYTFIFLSLVLRSLHTASPMHNLKIFMQNRQTCSQSVRTCFMHACTFVWSCAERSVYQSCTCKWVTFCMQCMLQSSCASPPFRALQKKYIYICGRHLLILFYRECPVKYTFIWMAAADSSYRTHILGLPKCVRRKFDA